MQLVPNEREEGMKQFLPKHQLCVCSPLIKSHSHHPMPSHPSFSSFSSKARKPIAAAKYQELLFLSRLRPGHVLFLVFKLQAFFVGVGEGGEKAEAWGKNERNVSLGAEFSIAYFKPN